MSDPLAGFNVVGAPTVVDPSRPDPLAGFRWVGRPPAVLPPRVRLHSDDLLRLAGVDASSHTGHGQVRGFRHLIKDDRAPEVEFCDLLLAIEQDRTVAPGDYVNPCELRREPAPGTKLLSDDDRAWLDQLAELDPGRVDDDDAKVLAGWHADVGTRSARRLIERVLDPIRRRHDLAAEQAQLRPLAARANRSIPARDKVWREGWERLIGERMAEESRVRLAPELAGASPEVREQMLALAEQEAHDTARTALGALWAEQAAQQRQAAADAAARLVALAGGADPATLAPAPALDNDLADAELAGARERGSRWRAERNADPLAGFRIVGSP